MEKRFLAFCLFVSLTCSAQLPVIPMALGSPTPIADFTNLLYADFETDSTESLSSAYVNGAIVVYWTNMAPINPTATSWDLQTSSAVWPYFTNNVTPTGKPALDLLNNNNTIGVNIPHWSANGSNQPNTVIMCVLIRSNATQFYYDCSAGGREFIDVVPNTSYGFFAGSGATITTPTVMSNFCIITAVMNGASSYYRTNGVLMGVGNPGANAMGTMILGNDATGATRFTGQICAFRIYAEAPSTNNLHIAEQNMATRYLGITLPSP